MSTLFEHGALPEHFLEHLRCLDNQAEHNILVKLLWKVKSGLECSKVLWTRELKEGLDRIRTLAVESHKQEVLNILVILSVTNKQPNKRWGPCLVCLARRRVHV